MAITKGGKISWEELSRLIRFLPTSDVDLVIGPKLGEDAAVIRLKDGFLVVHSDPITTAFWRIGWYAVHVAANDIAVRGVKPRYFLPVVLLPPRMGAREVEEIFRDMGEAAREVSGVVIGGHTEVTPYLERPIISMTAIGYSTGRFVSTSGARPGDYLVIVGRVGGEGASVVAWDFEEELAERGVDRALIGEAKNFLREISVVKTALSIAPYVDSMHDATEGGVIQAIREVSVASGVNVHVDLDMIRVGAAVREISKAMGLDPLKLLSSGCIVAAVPPSKLGVLEETLRGLNQVYSVAGRVGDFADKPVVELREKGRVVGVVDRDVVDEIYKLFG